MTAPNIEMIAALLRSCKVGRERGLRSPAAHLVGGSPESVSVELNSETALPFHWEQCLDMQTGEVYYFNRETGTRTSKDPRTVAGDYSSSYHSEEDVSSSSSDSFSGLASGGSSSRNDNEDSSDSTANSCLTSISSSSSPSLATAAEPLVSAGCRSCFMYFMVPKSDDSCPKCSGRLLKLGRHGNP
ncbi:protein CURLY FLAG LEAF 1-like [Curcuma longa]|uniref:protein CURLY FLAG LEAF 1-like n=1 Tax=Curcuma longa TaxID=136217 RepID=UPI003D9F3C4D